MANIYNMPPDTREREKIIGGIFDLRQFFWIALGIGGFALLCVIFFKILGIFVFILGLPLPIMGFVFALKMVDDMPLPTYLKYKRLYKKKIKYYINHGKHNTLEFDAPKVENKEIKEKFTWH